ncbi:MAG: SDR family oxidoreductase [Gemmatimonas sp.]|nr:SDR family oxidoreductase [Gemmatimonadaceae bacterium]
MAAKKHSGGRTARGNGSSSSTKTNGGSRTRPNTRAVFVASQRRAEANDAKQKGKKEKSGSQQPAVMKEPPAPYPKQHQSHPGIEAEITPRPRFEGSAYKAAGKLEGKVALVTGGDSGIGRAVAYFFAREGADVAIVYLSEEQRDAEETKRAIENVGKRCLLIPGDVTDSSFCADAVEQTRKQLGRFDILVNNAAFQQHQASIEDISDEQFELTFRTNIFGYFYMARAALKHLKRGGSIINTGSITGLEGSKEIIDYSSTKGAIHAFTKALAQNLVEKGIRVNCVAPGPVWTPLNVADKPAEKVSKHGSEVPMKRAAEPEELAPAYVYFASEADSSYVSGEVLSVLGGQTTAG